MKNNVLLMTLAMLAIVSCQTNTVKPDEPFSGNKDSISVFKRVKISWAATDYKEVEYDAANTPIRYTAQNLYNQGTGEVLKVVYNFVYSGKQLTRLDVSNGSSVNYTYDGDKVVRTEEFNSKGKLIITRLYDYSFENRLKRVDEATGEGDKKMETARTFTYDNKGNLTQLVDLTKDAQTGVYKVELVTRYSDYDSYKNTTNLWTIYPILPNVTFQVNNPTTITQYIEGQDGAEMPFHRKQYTYRYNAKGYPVSHTETDAGGPLTATYTYVDMY
ncbi:hypothetical protein GO755_40230 [Spirosoma sp. HMF4905]|uniref:DUF4595 domain-containing protein n=1 Tax=Spirosoma arboris TaxID=2682092 RepID=A0A7K1SR76_9BACT|nr:hypothetical protein [Spirosoma arboris]MVM36302.1 hypothetical protein [Spirosoma arboris]